MAAEKRWTLKQKTALSKALENLPENEHEKIYRIIKARDPDTLEDCPEGTSIEFALLSPQTLRELESLVASHSVNTPTESEIQENNPAEHETEESNSESISNTRKSPRIKGATGSAEKTEETEEVSIKTRLRRTSRKSEASHSK